MPRLTSYPSSPAVARGSRYSNLFFGLSSILILIATSSGCKINQNPKQHRSKVGPKPDPLVAIRAKPTCLVLSVGGIAGIASHLGAVQAIQKSGLEFDCVAGNSAGSLVGALLASQPKQPVTLGFDQLRSNYAEMTKEEGKKRGILGGLLATAAVVATGGAALPALAAGAATGTVAGRSVEKVDHARLSLALDQHFAGQSIEQLPVKFVTWHHSLEGSSLELKARFMGSVAEAVGESVKHPLLFGDLNLKQMKKIDPGLDRVSSTPLLDACEAYPSHKMLVLNASEREVFTKGLDCPFEVIELKPEEIDGKSLFLADARYQAALSKSARTVTSFLETSKYFGSRKNSPRSRLEESR